MVAENRKLQFSEREMNRIYECVRALGVSYAEFIHWATMQAVGELEGYARAVEGRGPDPDMAAMGRFERRVIAG